MAIKPVDFQVMIPRTMEAAKVTNDINQKNLSAQQQQQAATQHRAEDSLKQVYSRSQAQNARISEKQRDSGKKDQKGRKSGEDPDGNEEKGNKQNMDIKISTIDIKI